MTMLVRFLALLLAAAVVAPSMAPAIGVLVDGPIYVMRHLNTPEGERDPDLTAAGRANAVRLAKWFEGRPLQAIYVSNFRRTRQTAAPIAEARGIAVTLYDAADTQALIARLRRTTGPVLVIGHSNAVPDIVELLGGKRPAALSHPDFGDIWTIEKGRSTHIRLGD